jgi:Integrase zinc binding domain
MLHPAIIPENHPLARSIIQAFHDSMHHAGIDFVLWHVRQHIWITSGREAVKRVRHQCIQCRRFRPKATLQMMADVHWARLGCTGASFYLYFGGLLWADRGGSRARIYEEVGSVVYVFGDQSSLRGLGRLLNCG